MTYTLTLGGLHVQWDDGADGEVPVALAGDLDTLSAPVLVQALDTIRHAGREAMVLDLRSVPFIDSSGLGTLVAQWRICSDRGGRLRAVHPAPAVRHLLDFTGIGRYLLPED